MQTMPFSYFRAKQIGESRSKVDFDKHIREHGQKAKCVTEV